MGIKSRFGNIDLMIGYRGYGPRYGFTQGPNWWQARAGGLRLLIVWPTPNWRSR